MATETCTPEHEELTVSMCWALLRLADVGRLALRGDSDDVDVFPVNFVVDHGSIIFRTAEGTKLTRVITEQCGTRSRPR